MKLERLLDMGMGSVCNLTNTQFKDFVYDEIGVDIYNEKFEIRGNSKAKRLRSFWDIESNQNVALLSLAFLDYWEENFRATKPTEEDFYLLWALREVAYKDLLILKDMPNKAFNIAALEISTLEDSYLLLKLDIEKVLNEDKPQLALDRIHTYMTKYFRILCKKHSINFTEKENINNMYSKYIKFHENLGTFESIMTPKLMKLPTQVLERYNNVRNNESYAHSNDIIGYRESKLIVDFVLLVLAYVIDIEKEYDRS